jgi:IS5 family transposase
LIDFEGVKMKQLGLFDIENRYDRIDKCGDPLMKLNEVIDWEEFRPGLMKVREKERKSNAGAKSYDVVLMFKSLIIQSLYNLSDEELEYQMLDRWTFMRFLGVGPGDRVPDAKTIWLFREQLKEAGLVEELFKMFDRHLQVSGYVARKGQIVDASIVSVPKQRNTREENALIKEGSEPEDWNEAKRRQKDTEARWLKKNGKNYYGYKNHVNVDVKHKLIRGYAVTDASVHDSQVFGDLLHEGNRSKDVYGDSAYRSEEILEMLKGQGYREHLQRKGYRHRKLTDWEKQGNHTRSKIRSRIEHVFGVQAMMAGDLILRTIGIARARVKIGLRNLAYNMFRFHTLVAVM